MEAYFMVDSWLTVLQSYTESLRTACLLGLLHDVDAPKRLVVIWMQTQAHTWTHIYYVGTYIQVGKKKFILTQKIDGLPSPSCCHYQIFNNVLKVYRSSRWQLNQTRVEEFWFCSTKVCKMSCVQKWLDKWKQISIVCHWHLKLNHSLFIRQKLYIIRYIRCDLYFPPFHFVLSKLMVKSEFLYLFKKIWHCDTFLS